MSMSRVDGAGSAFMLRDGQQAWDDAAEELDCTPGNEMLDEASYDEMLEYWYEHAEGMVYSMIGWCAVGCHHLAEEAWQANEEERAQNEGHRWHESQPRKSQLYSQEDPELCGKPLVFMFYLRSLDSRTHLSRLPSRALQIPLVSMPGMKLELMMWTKWVCTVLVRSPLCQCQGGHCVFVGRSHFYYRSPLLSLRHLRVHCRWRLACCCR
jgi:hypothetical protein